jgi:hypothetical protein
MMNSFAAAESTDTTLSDESGILPVQFYQGRRDAGEDGPTRRLMTAILVDAIHCYQAGAGRGWRDQDAAEARLWMFGVYPEFPFSFANVCAELGISPGRIRERLLLDDERIAAGVRPPFLRRSAIRPLQVRSGRRTSHHRPSRSERRGKVVKLVP